MGLVTALFICVAVSSIASVVSQQYACNSGDVRGVTLQPNAVHFVDPDGKARSIPVEIPRLADAATVTFDDGCESPRVAFHSAAVRHVCVLGAAMSLLAAYLAAHQ